MRAFYALTAAAGVGVLAGWAFAGPIDRLLAQVLYAAADARDWRAGRRLD